MKKSEIFGWHLIMDIYDCNHKIKMCSDIKIFVKKLCRILKMKAYGPCVVEHFGHSNDMTSGYSAYQLIETSNISCHFSEKYGTAFIDVFSCKQFDQIKAMKYVVTFFGATIRNHQLIIRN